MDARVKPAHDERARICRLLAASPRAQAQSEYTPATNQPDGQIKQNPVQPFAKKYST
jgi:hypothetical protein